MCIRDSAYISQGMDAEEAEEAAVKEMGDPVEAGSLLDSIHRPRMAWRMIGLIGALSIAGFIILNLLQRNFSDMTFVAVSYTHLLASADTEPQPKYCGWLPNPVGVLP